MWNDLLLGDPNLTTDLIIHEIQNCIRLSKLVLVNVIVLVKVIKAAKDKFDEKQFECNSKNPRNLWKHINDKIGNTKRNSCDIDYLTDSNNVRIEGKEILANRMNNYFCSVGQKLHDKLGNSNNRLYLPEMNEKTIYINYTSTDEIKNIVKNMKIKAGGVDNISTRVFKAIIDIIVGSLAYLFNRCIELSIWPDALKNAEVVPIHKGKQKCKEENYRPISLTSNLAKIY